MTTEERLEKLERELTAAKRRNRWMLTVVLIVFASLYQCAIALSTNGNIMSAAATGTVQEAVNVATQTTDKVNITTKSGVIYTNCSVVGTKPSYITIFHASGIARILFTDLSNELQAKYNYNPTNAAAYIQAVRQKQAAAVMRQKIKETDFTGGPREIINVTKIWEPNKYNRAIKQVDGMVVGQDFNSAVYKIVLKKGGGVVMTELHYKSTYSGRTMSASGMHYAMQRSANTRKQKVSGRNIFLVGLSKRLAANDEWTGKIYECGMFDVYTGHPPMRMYATTKELAVEILQAQQK